LIELLIVVAIIGILAAIAIPNFLGARTKAKVSRAFADMRTIGTALETYMLDNGEYPASTDSAIPTSAVQPEYMSTVPTDPFDPNKGQFRYYTTPTDTATAWLLVSNGPDLTASVSAWPSDSTYIKSGQLGGADSVVPTKQEEGHDASPWSDGKSAASDGDLGRAGGNL